MESEFQIREFLEEAGHLKEDGLNDPQAQEALLGSIANLSGGSVAEFGCRTGIVAELVLRKSKNVSSYIGIESSPLLLNVALKRLAGFKQASLEPVISGEPTPLADGSQDLVVAAYLLEQLKMDHLYMIFSEARRTTKMGGHCLLLARSPGRNFREKLASSFWKKFGQSAIELDHFISPEDWAVEEDRYFSHLGKLSRLLRLRRIP